MNVLVSLFNSLPGAAGQGLIWGIMAIGVYITYKILDVADLTVDGSLATGGAVAALCVSMGWNPWLAVLAAVLAGMLAGLATGVLHTACGIPAILAGILTQLALYSINLRIMAIGDENATTKATLAVSVDKNDLLLSSRYVREPALNNPLLLLVLLTAAVIALLYWFFGTEQGSALRATGANQNMARAQGINTDFCKVLGLMVSNGLVGLSGALLSQALPTSTWAAAPSSSAWPPWSSARCSSARSSAISPCGCSAWPSAPSSTTWSSRCCCGPGSSTPTT